APVMAMPLIVRVVVPTFVNVTVLVPLVAPIATVPKLKLAGESFAVVPIPLRLTFCRLPAPLSLPLSTAVRVPDAVGLNVTLITQLAPPASQLPPLLAYATLFRSAPVMAMPLIVRVVVPTFVNVTVLVPLVAPIATVPKFKLAGESFAVVPIPLRLTFCGLPRSEERRVGNAGSVRDAVGLNVKIIA